MRYLLDTNICVYLIRKHPPVLLQRLSKRPIWDLAVSSITVAELQFGVRKSSLPARNQRALDEFLVPLVILDFDYDAAISYGHIRAYLEARGTPIGPLDTLIAAHTLSQELTLVTNNTREFSRVPGLTVEDWTTE